MMYEENLTQEQRVYAILEDGDWVDGMIFLHLDKPITQFHARIWGLQKKGIKIESRFKEGRNWKEYRLVKDKQPRLL